MKNFILLALISISYCRLTYAQDCHWFYKYKNYSFSVAERITQINSDQDILDSNIPIEPLRTLLKSDVMQVDSLSKKINLKKLTLSLGTLFSDDGLDPFSFYRVATDSTGKKTLFIDYIYVPESLRGKGISTDIFKMILENESDISFVAFYLDESNRSAYFKHKNLKKQSRIKQTPIYRSLSKFGFSKISFATENNYSGFVNSKNQRKEFPFVVLTKSNH